MDGKIVFGKNSDKMHHDLEVFEKQIGECKEGIKSDPKIRVWPKRYTSPGKCTFRKSCVL